MPIQSLRYVRKSLSIFLLAVFITSDMGCTYYMVAARAERGNQGATASTDPAVVIPLLAPSNNIIVQFPGGARISNTFRFKDANSIYVGAKKNGFERRIPIDSIEAIKIVDKVDGRIYAIAKQGGDPLFTVPEFRTGSYIRIQIKGGESLNTFFLRSNKDNLYVRDGRGGERAIPRGDILYVRLASERKYLILHHKGYEYHLKFAALNPKQTQLVGIVEPLPDNHRFYEEMNPKGSTRYSPAAGDPTNEVHIYATDAVVAGTDVSIPIPAISKIEIYGPDAGRTAGGVLGITVGIVVVLGIIILASKKSCPFVYTYDGETYSLAGEMYGGAIYPQLERDDYLPLPSFKPVNGSYTLKIANQLKEVQHTNVANLLVAAHDDSVDVLLDNQGNPQTIHSPMQPLSATSGKGTDFLHTVMQKDDKSYLFEDGTRTRDDISHLELKFLKPPHATRAKLILKATNSYWLDYLYGKFNEQFGTYLPRFVEKQEKEPASKLQAWTHDQHIPLAISTKKDSGWSPVDFFNVMGPLASRELVMPVDLKGIHGDTVTIKLETGYRFWEVDYAAMDFSENAPVQLTQIKPSAAIDETGADVTSTLAARDDQYLVQPDIGNEVIVTYPALPALGKRQTVFLHSSGYYQSTVTYPNRPHWFKLYSFRKEGSFTRFSRSEYKIFERDHAQTPLAAIDNNKDQKP